MRSNYFNVYDGQRHLSPDDENRFTACADGVRRGSRNDVGGRRSGPSRHLTGCLILRICLLMLTTSAWSAELQPLTPQAAPGLVLPDASGDHWQLQDFTGRVVLINFWASWCTPCLEEIPSLNALAAQFEAKDLQVIAVNVGENRRRVETVSRQLALRPIVLLDIDSNVFHDWQAAVLPASYIVDRQGRLRFQAIGIVDWGRPDVVAQIEQLMAE